MLKECTRTKCAYYRYLQGTSMASPHAAGVAALAVAQFGKPDGKGGVGLAPAEVERLLTTTATDTPCPAQNPYVYPNLPAPVSRRRCARARRSATASTVTASWTPSAS